MIYLDESLTQTLAAGDKDGVLAALQQALKLEHSTIPPYLYALYSLVPGANDVVAAVIDSVVVEEMLHLTLAANLINALGGTPVIDTPDFVPTYPGPLPGSVEGALIVGLAPCSIDLIRGVFMGIEQPEDPLEFPVELVAGAGDGPLTIGMFYRRVKDTIVGLGDGAFLHGPRRQIGPDQMANSIVVVDVDSACQAINTVIDQGEGTRTAPLEVVGSGYAHYYRFAEIVNGGLLVPNSDSGPATPPDQRYVYDTINHPLPFDAKGVYRVPINPGATGYAPGSVGEAANDNFNYAYTSLLKVLHRALNGEPKLLDAALGLMMSLRQQAMDMMSGTDTSSQNIGPTFEYQLVNRVSASA